MEGAQTQEFGATPQLLLHGRQISRLLQDHQRLQPRSDRRPLLHSAVSTHGRKGKADRRFIFLKEATLGSGRMSNISASRATLDPV